MNRSFRPVVEVLPRIDTPSTLYTPIDIEEVPDNTEINQFTFGWSLQQAGFLPDGPILTSIKTGTLPNMLPAPLGGGVVNPAPAPTTPYLPAGTQVAPGPQTTPYMYPGPLASPNPIVIVYPTTGGLATGGLVLASQTLLYTPPVTSVAIPVNPLA